jgi:hypothetical protein
VKEENRDEKKIKMKAEKNRQGLKTPIKMNISMKTEIKK